MANKDKRDQLVETALEMFTERGCNAVTMDDIAQAEHISKRTLYETFANKEELLAECLMLLHERINQAHRQAHQQVDEPLLVAMYMLREGTMVNQRYKRLLAESLRYYPEIHNRFFAMHTEQMTMMMYKGFDYMQEHDYLRENVDIDLAVKFMCNFIQHWCPTESNNYQAATKQFNEICFTYLRGLLSVGAIQRYESEEEHYRRVMKELGLD